MTLQQYIEHKGVNAVARELGVEPQTVSAWKNLKSVPRPQTARKLVEMTNNILSLNSIYDPFVNNFLKENKKARGQHD